SRRDGPGACRNRRRRGETSHTTGAGRLGLSEAEASPPPGHTVRVDPSVTRPRPRLTLPGSGLGGRLFEYCLGTSHMRRPLEFSAPSEQPSARAFEMVGIVREPTDGPEKLFGVAGPERS